MLQFGLYLLAHCYLNYRNGKAIGYEAKEEDEPAERMIPESEHNRIVAVSLSFKQFYGRFLGERCRDCST
jgi:hypothetical protein